MIHKTYDINKESRRRNLGKMSTLSILKRVVVSHFTLGVKLGTHELPVGDVKGVVWRLRTIKRY